MYGVVLSRRRDEIVIDLFRQNAGIFPFSAAIIAYAALLDLMMPYMSGIEIPTQLRQDEATRHIPGIILTASTEHETHVDALRPCAYDFLNELVLCQRCRDGCYP